MTRPGPAWRAAVAGRLRSGAYIAVEDGRVRAGTSATDSRRLPPAEAMLAALERSHEVPAARGRDAAIVGRIASAGPAGGATYGRAAE